MVKKLITVSFLLFFFTLSAQKAEKTDIKEKQAQAMVERIAETIEISREQRAQILEIATDYVIANEKAYLSGKRIEDRVEAKAKLYAEYEAALNKTLTDEQRKSLAAKQEERKSELRKTVESKMQQKE
jgi:competence protein ComGC